MAMTISGFICSKVRVVAGCFSRMLMRCQPSLVVMMVGVFSGVAKQASVKSFAMRPRWIQPRFPALFLVRSSSLWVAAFVGQSRLLRHLARVCWAYFAFSAGDWPGAGSRAMKMCWTLTRSGVVAFSLKSLYHCWAS